MTVAYHEVTHAGEEGGHRGREVGFEYLRVARVAPHHTRAHVYRERVLRHRMLEIQSNRKESVTMTPSEHINLNKQGPGQV
jgi:hypothetical protein